MNVRDKSVIKTTKDISDSNSYMQMAKSSGIVAFVQVFQMVFGLIRNKAIALIVGTSGFGIWSLYQTFLEMTGNFSVFGLDRGGVREIAKKADDAEDLGKCIFSFRLIIIFFSILCSIVVFVGSKRISIFLFNDVSYSLGIKIISFIVIIQGLFKAEYAILNGLHAIRYIAYSQIISAIVGSIGAILFVYFGEEKYIVLGLSVVIVSGLLTTSYYVRKLNVKTIVPSFRELLPISKQLLFLGLGFTVSGLASTVMTILSRSYLSSHYSLDAVGIYQASWTISNLYIGIILNAMGIDFLPRLSKVSDDNDKSNKMINEQIDFSIPLASIGVTIILLFSSTILSLLYTSDFVSGVTIIRWQVIGVFMRVLAFPFSYAIMAKAKPIQYAITQIVFWTSDYLLLLFFSSLFGFNGLGINYVVAYVGFLTMVYLFSRYNSNFSFSKRTLVTVLTNVSIILTVWIICFFVDGFLHYIVGFLVVILQLLYVNHHIKARMQIDLVGYIKNKVLHKIK